MHVDLKDVESLGQTPWGERRVVPIVGGAFEGPRLRGKVEPGGADWQVVHPSGMITVDTRYALRTDNGALIYIATKGVRTAAPDVAQRMMRGDPVDPSEYYFRVTAILETGADAYYWVNERLFVASAIRQPRAVEYDLYALT